MDAPPLNPLRVRANALLHTNNQHIGCRRTLIATARIGSKCHLPMPTSRKKWTTYDRDTVKFRQKNACALCEDVLEPGNYDFDHILALGLGGEDVLDNLQAICLKCHRRKTIQDLRMMQQLRRDDVDRDLAERSHRPCQRCDSCGAPLVDRERQRADDVLAASFRERFAYRPRKGK